MDCPIKLRRLGLNQSLKVHALDFKCSVPLMLERMRKGNKNVFQGSGSKVIENEPSTFNQAC